MAILYEWRIKTRTPINELLRQAIIKIDEIIREREEKEKA